MLGIIRYIIKTWQPETKDQSLTFGTAIAQIATTNHFFQKKLFLQVP